MPARRHLLALLAALLWCVPAAGAASPPEPLGSSLAALRAQEGLPQPVSGTDAQVAEALALRAGAEAGSLALARSWERSAPGAGAGYLCGVCRPSAPGPQGTQLVEMVAHSGWDAGQLLGTVREAAAVLLDPRLVGLSAAHGPGGTLALVARIDPALPLERPVLWPRRLQAAEPGRLRVLVPAGSRPLLVLDGPGGRLVSGRDFSLAITDRGGGALALGPSPYGAPPPLAHGARYRVLAGGRPAGTLRTAAGPPGRPRLSGLPVRGRRIVLAAVASAPAPVRSVWARIGSRLEMTRGNGTCGPLASCTDSVRGGYRISLAPEHLAGDPGTLAFVALHELGHVADRAGLTPAGRQSISARMRAGGRWRCVIDPSRVDPAVARSRWCLSDEEQWADDFARYATGRPRSQQAYGARALLGPAQVARVLRAHWAPRAGSEGDLDWTGPGARPARALPPG